MKKPVPALARVFEMLISVVRTVFSICVLAALSGCSPFSLESKFVAISQNVDIGPGQFTIELEGHIPHDRDVSVCVSTPDSLQVESYERWKEDPANFFGAPSISAHFFFVPGGEIAHDAFLPSWFRGVGSFDNVVAYCARPRMRPAAGASLARVILRKEETATFPLVFLVHRPVL